MTDNNIGLIIYSHGGSVGDNTLMSMGVQNL